MPAPITTGGIRTHLKLNGLDTERFPTASISAPFLIPADYHNTLLCFRVRLQLPFVSRHSGQEEEGYLL